MMLGPEDFARLVGHLELATARLLLRRYRPRDIDTDIEHQRNEHIARYTREVPSVEDARMKAEISCAEWTGADGQWCAFVVTRRGGEEMLGAISFKVDADSESVEVGFRFHPDFHGQGYAEESCRALLRFLFERALVRKVTSHCITENAASYRLMERLGMQREGTLRAAVRHCGHWWDIHLYGLFAEELTS